MDFMDYGYDHLYHGRYSKAYAKKVADELGPDCSKDRIPCETRRVDEVERATKRAIERARAFYPTAFESFSSMKEIIACGKTLRAGMFFFARCLFDRIGEITSEDGFLEKVSKNGLIKKPAYEPPKDKKQADEYKKEKKIYEGKVYVFEKTASHVYEIAVLVHKLRQACADFLMRSPEARNPQITRASPEEACAIVEGMKNACDYIGRNFELITSGKAIEFSEYMQETLLPKYRSTRSSEFVRGLSAEITKRKMKDSKDPRFAKTLRLNSLIT
jgi:hypothetical protein